MCSRRDNVSVQEVGCLWYHERKNVIWKFWNTGIPFLTIQEVLDSNSDCKPIYPEVFCSFPQYLQAVSRTVPQIGPWLLPSMIFLFIIHLLSYSSVLYSLSYCAIKWTTNKNRNTLIEFCGNTSVGRVMLSFVSPHPFE